MFFGSIPALVTPFAAGRVDEAAFRDLVEWQIDEGSSGAGAVRHDRRGRDARTRRASPADRAGGRGGARAGAGDRRLRQSNSTAASIAHIKAAAGRRAPTPRWSSSPYYNKPSQAGIAAHFAPSPTPRTCRSSSTTCPRRTVADIAVETMAEVVATARSSSGSRTPPAISPGSPPSGSPAARSSASCRGNDDMALGFNAMGGVGCISVTANVAPRLCADFQAATREGRWDEALDAPGPALSRSTPRCSPTPRRGRPNMRCRRSAPASRPSCACR